MYLIRCGWSPDSPSSFFLYSSYFPSAISRSRLEGDRADFFGRPRGRLAFVIESDKLPILLGGRGGGPIDTGQHLVYTNDSPLSNLYVSMLDAFGTPADRFADSTGPLRGLLHT